jgi:multiple sugar transport system substrate-binding protein
MEVGSIRRGLRRLALPAALVAATSLALAGCAGSSGPSSSGGGSSEGGTLTVWFPGNSQPEIDLVTKTLVPEFEKKNNVTVKVTYVDWGDLSPKLNAAFAAGTAPDVFGHGPAAAADLVANDRVVNLDNDIKSLPASDRDDLNAALDGGKVDGKQYLTPLSISGQLVVYRADLLKEAGIDPSTLTTWNAVRNAAQKLTVREGGTVKRAGLLLGTAAIQRSITFNALLAAQGGAMTNKDGSKVTFDSTAGVDALTFFDSLYQGSSTVGADVGNDYLNSAPAQQPLVTGAAAMTMLTSQAAVQVAAANPGLKLGVLPALSFKKPAAFGGAGAGLFINADSNQQKLAWKFLEFMTSPEISTQYAAGTGGIPIRASAANSDYVKGSPIVQEFLKQAKNYVPNPNVPKWTQIRDVLDASLEQALNGAATPKQALDQAAQQATAVIGK